jgi:hypothetical protein
MLNSKNLQKRYTFLQTLDKFYTEHTFPLSIFGANCQTSAAGIYERKRPKSSIIQNELRVNILLALNK